MDEIIKNFKTCKCGGAICAEHALYGHFYDKEKEQLMNGVLGYKMKCTKCYNDLFYSKEDYEQFLKEVK